MRKINQMEPWIDEREKQAVADYLDSDGWLTEFKRTREFEQMIAKHVGSTYCSALSNGTVTLFTALMALGITRGDEVIVPNLTMIASANAVLLAGARPMFVDIDRTTLCMDLDLVEQAINSKTKALMVVSLNGRSPDMNRLLTLARQHGLFVIEDAAQSLGSRFQGLHLGTFGEIGSFSFSTPKIITTGQGGALVTDDPDLFERISMIKNFGRRESGVDRHEMLGYNFKFTDLQAVIGIEQMKKLDWRIERKKAMFALYHRELAGLEEVEFVETDLCDTAPWFVDILVADPKALANFLEQRGIGTRPFYPPVHTQAPYKSSAHYPVSEEISDHGLWLPSSLFLSDEDIVGICEAIKSFYRGS